MPNSYSRKNCLDCHLSLLIPESGLLIIFAIRFIISEIFVVDIVWFWTHNDLKEIRSYIKEITLLFVVDYFCMNFVWIYMKRPWRPYYQDTRMIINGDFCLTLGCIKINSLELEILKFNLLKKFWGNIFCICFSCL